MRIVPCLALLLLVFSVSAQAPEPAPLARGSVPGEPHHHLRIENEYVRVYYVEVPPHENTQLHQHDHDYIYVSLGPADVVNAVRDKPEVHLALTDGETHFTRGGFAHVARNLADTPFRNVTIELLHPQGEPRNICAQVLVGAPEGDCPKSVAMPGGLRKEPLLETRNTFVDLVALDPSLGAVSIRPQSEALIVFLGETQIQGHSINAPTEKVVKGHVIWISGGAGETIWNSERKDLRYLQLTFSAAGSKP